MSKQVVRSVLVVTIAEWVSHYRSEADEGSGGRRGGQETKKESQDAPISSHKENVTN